MTSTGLSREQTTRYAGPVEFSSTGNLGDIILLPANAKLATVSGKVNWDKPTKTPLPGQVRFQSTQNTRLWVQTTLDSTGTYSAELPAGKYEVTLGEVYYQHEENLYETAPGKRVIVDAPSSGAITAAAITIPSDPVPDLIPAKGYFMISTRLKQVKYDRFIETYRKYYNIPGVSLALIKDGKVVYHKTYGVANTMTGQKVDENTLFEAASITKPVFSFAVLRLAERGIVDLDKPLYLYLPYEDIAYDDRYKLMTARHVLTHRTGFPNWRWGNEDRKLNLRFTPGTDYNYSGEGFEYLKMVVEKITGKKVEQVLQEEVITPIGLYHTFFSKNDSLQRMVAYGHYNGLPSNNELNESPGMAYSMHTEAKIFTRFMLYMLEQKGLKSQTYDTMFQKHSDFKYDSTDEKPKYPVYMGMSLEMREIPFRQILWPWR